MKPVVHQILVSASEGDAVTSMALSLRDELRKNCESDVYAHWRHGPRMLAECRPLGDLPPSPEVSVLVHHLTIGHESVSDLLRRRVEKIVVSYHNITPSSSYELHSPDFAADLERGREDLRHLSEKAVLALCDSEYNSKDLKEAGYRNIAVVPAGLQVDRLRTTEIDPVIVHETSRRFPRGYVVVVGQLMPHKRIEQAMEAVHLLNTTHWSGLGLVVCGSGRNDGYVMALERFRAVTGMADVQFTGYVTDRQLSTYVRSSRALLGMSDHEGLCIPPLEAAAVGVPVVIKGAGAVPETMGDGAFVLPADAGPSEASEALAMVVEEGPVRWSLIDAGYRRIMDFTASNPAASASRMILGVLE